MTCQEMHNLIPAYLADVLEQDETLAVRAHLATGCPRCAAALAEAEATLAMLPLSLNPLNPAGHVRARLLQGLSRQPQAQTPDVLWKISRSWVAAIIVFGFLVPAIVFGLTFVRQQASRKQNAAVLARVAEVEERLRLTQDLAAKVEQLKDDKLALTQRLQMLESPAVSVISLKGTELQPKAIARVFWDTEHGVYRFSVRGLVPLEEAKTYALWFITDKEEKIPVGTFNIRDGRGEITADVPANIGRVALAAITDEPAGGSPQPTGTIQMVGKLPD